MTFSNLVDTTGNDIFGVEYFSFHYISLVGLVCILVGFHIFGGNWKGGAISRPGRKRPFPPGCVCVALVRYAMAVLFSRQ
jgi:hypothetical protein